MNFLRVSIIILIAIAAAAGGLYLGINYEQDAQNEEDAYQAILGARARTIAVVSLDEGVDVEGLNQKYANSIIEENGRQFNLTTYQMAEKGLEDGAYDAIILFPPDFSEKVASVNNMNPQKISVDILINDRLPEAAYIDTYKILTEFQMNVNSTLSYMYLVSIYDELHDAQDKSGRLLSNNEKVLDAIEEVDDFNFTRNLNMGDIPQVNLEIQTTDFQPFVNNVNGYAKDMRDVYMNSYTAAQSAYQVMQGQLSTHIGVAKKANDDINDIYSALKSSGSGSWLFDAQKYGSDLSEWGANANKWLEDSNDTIDDYKTDLTSIIGIAEKINNAADEIYSAAEMLLSNSQLDPDDRINLKKLIDDRDTAIAGGATDPLKISDIALEKLKNLPSTLTLYTSPVPTAPDTLKIPDITPETFTKFNDALADIENTASSYAPLNYLTTTDESAAMSIISAYESETSKTKGEFDKLQATHIEVVNGAFVGYNQHVSILRQIINEAYTDELKQIDSAKNIFVETGRTVSEENHRLISDFSSKIPNSRSGQSVNQTVAEFVASPVEVISPDIRGVVDPEDGRNKNLPLLILSVCLIALIVTIIIYAVQYRRSRT